jgi:hypothetical protein
MSNETLESRTQESMQTTAKRTRKEIGHSSRVRKVEQ